MYALKATAPAVTGARSRNETRAAASRSSPRKRAAEIVIPERGDAGRQREHLGEADVEALTRSDLVDRLTLRAPIRPREHEAADDQQDRDLPWLPEVVLDEALPEPTGDHRRDRADRDRPGESLIRARDRAPPERTTRNAFNRRTISVRK